MNRRPSKLPTTLLRNRELLLLNQESREGREIYRDRTFIVWEARRESRAVFNLSEEPGYFSGRMDVLELPKDCGSGRDVFTGGELTLEVPAHGVKLGSWDSVS